MMAGEHAPGSLVKPPEREAPPGLLRIRALGRELGPDRAAQHLALRYGARLALLKAYSDARLAAIAAGKVQATEAGNPALTIDPRDVPRSGKAAVWKYLHAQTHISRESRFWLCLDALAQTELCGKATLCRVPHDRPGWTVGRGGENLFVVMNGSAIVAPAKEEGAEHDEVDQSAAAAAEASEGDRAMLDEPIWRGEPPSNADSRPPAHVFGHLPMPDDVDALLKDAAAEASALKAFLEVEATRAAGYGLVEGQVDAFFSPGPAPAPAAEAPGFFLTSEAAFDETELVPVEPPPWPDADMDKRSREHTAEGPRPVAEIPSVRRDDDSHHLAEGDQQDLSLAMTTSDAGDHDEATVEETPFSVADARSFDDLATPNYEAQDAAEDALNDEDEAFAADAMRRLDVFSKNQKLSSFRPSEDLPRWPWLCHAGLQEDGTSTCHALQLSSKLVRPRERVGASQVRGNFRRAGGLRRPGLRRVSVGEFPRLGRGRRRRN